MKPIKEILHNNIYNDLSYYICEAKFDQYIPNDSKDIRAKFKALIVACNKFNSKLEKYSIDVKDVEDLLVDIFKDSNNKSKELFIYSPDSTYFKIPYVYIEDVKRAFNNKRFNRSFKLKLLDDIKLVVYTNNHIKIFETGAGSIGRISTSQQETATCMVWNKYVEQVNEFNLDNVNCIDSVVKDISCNFDTSWINSFCDQVKAISSYLGEEYPKYRMCRFGDNDEVSKAYKELITKYVDKIKNDGQSIGRRKDNYDPSDVLIYKVGVLNDIASTISNLTTSINNQPNIIDVKKSFIDDLFSKKLLMGISLKKISKAGAARYQLFNDKTNNDEKNNVIQNVSKFRIKSKSGSQLVIECDGPFNFSNLTDASGDEVGKQRSVILTMRSFGSGSTGVDCKLHEDAAPLGKCSVDVWRSIIGAGISTPTDKCIELFNEYIKNNDESKVRGKLTDIIKSAVKEGSLCFPFILIH